jgi:hypothetical protein
MLELRLDHGERYRFMEEMSWEELVALRSIWEKPEEEWTRLEHRFVEEMFARDPSMHELDKPD